MTVTFLELGSLGRMGNGLFQVAATIGHAMEYNQDYVFPKWQYMNDFNIPSEKFKNKNRIRVLKRYEEPHFHYAKIPRLSHLSLHGYFQSARYHGRFQDDIKRLLTPSRSAEKMDGVTSIHVRRGDYLVHKGCYTILGKNYYEPAMEFCDTKRYLVFSDDIKWCKKFFVGNQFEFSEEEDPVMDLKLMSVCSNNIIANSSFSWWGAYLNDNPDKKVIAPMNWFGPKLAPTHNTKDLIPDEWLRI